MIENTQSFEEALAALETILSQLEEGELPLEEMMALYEQGQALVLTCNNLLNNAQLRLEQLQDGQAVETPFTEPEER